MFDGPLFHLRFISGLCPCLEKDEDKQARLALKHVHGKPILWNSKAGSGKGFNLGRLFGAAGKSPDLVATRLWAHDNDDNEPELYLETVSSSNPKLATVILGRIDKVLLDANNEILFLSKPTPDEPAKELLRFTPLASLPVATTAVASSDTTTTSPQPPQQQQLLSVELVHLFLHNLQVLVEHERQRRAALNETYEESRGNFLVVRAKQAKHFAHREYELREQKRTREQRKAQLVAESGGLKYTALAMANQNSNSRDVV
jgi:hypothetical protein